MISHRYLITFIHQKIKKFRHQGSQDTIFLNPKVSAVMSSRQLAKFESMTHLDLKVSCSETSTNINGERRQHVNFNRMKLHNLLKVGTCLDCFKSK